FSTYNWGSLSEIWGGGGPVWFDDPVASNGGQPLMGYEAFYFDNFFDGETANPLGDSGRLFYADNIAENYDAYAEYAAQVAGEWPGGASWVPLANRSGTTGYFLPGEINPVVETNHAAYFMVNFDSQFDNGWNLTGNVGLRYSDTKRDATGFLSFPPLNPDQFSSEEECAAELPEGETPTPFCGLPLDVREAARMYANGAIIPVSATLNDDHWLPSLNLKLEVSEGLQFRAAF